MLKIKEVFLSLSAAAGSRWWSFGFSSFASVWRGEHSHMLSSSIRRHIFVFFGNKLNFTSSALRSVSSTTWLCKKKNQHFWGIVSSKIRLYDIMESFAIYLIFMVNIIINADLNAACCSHTFTAHIRESFPGHRWWWPKHTRVIKEEKRIEKESLKSPGWWKFIKRSKRSSHDSSVCSCHNKDSKIMLKSFFLWENRERDEVK